MRRLLRFLLGASFLLAATPSLAADPNNSKAAQRHFQEGTRLMNAGDYEHARLEFAYANVLVHTPNALWNMAMCEYFSAHPVDSLNHLRLLVRDPEADATDVRAANEKYIPDLVQKVAQVEIEAPKGTALELETKDKLGIAPLADPVAVPPGKHQILGALGSEVMTKDIDVRPGQTIHIRLGSASQPPAGAVDDVATLLVTSPTSPPPPATTDSGVHRERTSTQKIATIALGAGAVGLLVVSSVMFANASSESNTYNNLKASTGPQSCPSGPGCADLLGSLRSHNNDLTAGYVLGGSALILAGAAAVVWFGPFGRKTDDTRAVVTPIVGPGIAGLTLTRAF